MPGHLRDQALSLLAQANNHGDLAVKLSSLKQAKDILAAAGPSIAPELFPYLAELQYSPEALVRKSLIEVVEEIGLKAMGHSSILMPVLLALLKDNNSAVARQSIVSGTNFFCSILEELSLQFHQHGIVERWLEELWTWMIKFKDAVYGILWQGLPLMVICLSPLILNPKPHGESPWFLGSGATNHIMFNLNNLSLFSPYHGVDKVVVGDGE